MHVILFFDGLQSLLDLILVRRNAMRGGVLSVVDDKEVRIGIL